MKTERRHELQTNELADWLGRAIELVEENARAAVGVVVAVAVIVIAYFFMRSESSSKSVKGWDRYFQAITARDATEMLTVAEGFPNTPVGIWARLTVADNQLDAGVNLLFRNRAEANGQLRQAVSNYDEVANSSVAAKHATLEQRALWGLARAYESLNELEKARATYARLADLNAWEHPMFGTEADRRLKSLDRASTKVFYDWFARLEPTPPAAAQQKLNLENLPDEPPADSSSATPGEKLEGQPAVIETAPATAPPEESKAAAESAPPAESSSAAPPAAETTPAQPAEQKPEPAANP